MVQCVLHGVSNSSILYFHLLSVVHFLVQIYLSEIYDLCF